MYIYLETPGVFCLVLFEKDVFFCLCCRKVLVLAAVFFSKLLHSCVFAALSMDFCCDGSALTLSVSSSVLSELLGKCLGCDGYPRNTQDMNAHECHGHNFCTPCLRAAYSYKSVCCLILGFYLFGSTFFDLGFLLW